MISRQILGSIAAHKYGIIHSNEDVNIHTLTLIHSWEWSISNFPCKLTRNITSHSKENLAFHSLLRWKVILLPVLPTSLIHFLSNRLGECTFWMRPCCLKLRTLMVPICKFIQGSSDTFKYQNWSTRSTIHKIVLIHTFEKSWHSIQFPASASHSYYYYTFSLAKQSHIVAVELFSMWAVS